MVIKTEDKYKKIFLDDIMYCLADGAYTKFYFKNEETLLIAKLLKNVEQDLKDTHFYRVSRKFMVNLNHCHEILTRGGYELVLSDGTKLPVSRSRYKQLVEHFCVHS